MPTAANAADRDRVAYAQVFFRDPLIGQAARAGVTHRLADGFARRGTEVRRAMSRWSSQRTGTSDEFLWSSADGTAQVAVHPGRHEDDPHWVVAVELPLQDTDLPTLARTVRDLGEWVAADFGHLTVLGDEDGVRPTMYLTSRDLRRWLPEVWHGLLFGPPYVDLIGEQRIRRAPAHAVEPTGPRRFWVALSDWDAVASADEAGEVDARRQAVHAHLGKDLFWRPDRRVYRTPGFAAAADPAQYPADRTNDRNGSGLPAGDMEVR